MTATDRRLKTEDRSPIDWSRVDRVLVVKLRSIGDTVLATPSLIALRRFLPDAQIDILLEDWVAPVLDGLDAVDSVVSIPTKDTLILRHTRSMLTPRVARLLGRDPEKISTREIYGRASRTDLILVRAAIAWKLRETKYDVAFNLHGGTTATGFVRASGARHRVGFAYYQYSFLYNHLLSSASDFWGREKTHSAEQQLALLGSVGVPVDDRPKSRLAVTESASRSIDDRLANSELHTPHSALALLHPGTAFFTKQWPVENFARTAEHLAGRGFDVLAISSKAESATLDELVAASKVPITTFDDLTLPEITALASKARVFLGNDSGIAHIAAAVGTPSVVIFGSSNRDHWRPWTAAPNEIVFEEYPCQPCPGYECKEFGEPRCILSVSTDKVFAAIERVLSPVK